MTKVKKRVNKPKEATRNGGGTIVVKKASQRPKGFYSAPSFIDLFNDDSQLREDLREF